MGNAIISRREQRELKKTQENYDFEEKLLPEELKSCTTKYTCFLPNGGVLISGYVFMVKYTSCEKEMVLCYKLCIKNIQSIKEEQHERYYQKH